MLKSKIGKNYEIHDCERISQGDILRDFSFVVIDENRNTIEITFQYVVVLSQDCDLQQGSNFANAEVDKSNSCKKFNQFLPSVLFVPAFPSEIVRSGQHIQEIYKVVSEKISSAPWKVVINNQNPRYHFLPANIENQIPELVLDFKAYYTLPFNYFCSLHKLHYLATVNEIFRERLSQRFANFLNRIGLPEIA